MKFQIQPNKKSPASAALYLHISAETHAEIKKLAVENGCSMVQIAIQMIEHCLKDMKGETK